MFYLSVLLGAAGAWLMSRFGNLVGLMDAPGKRSSHSVLTPKGGGIGILVAFLTVSIFSGSSWLAWLPAAGLSLFSLYSDRRDLYPRLRLVAQFVASVVFLVGSGYFLQTGLADLIVTMVFAIFIVGTANFYNFMDGINGIAALTGMTAFGFLAYFYWLNTGALDPVALAMVGSCAGFLPFNFPRAQVFMGDVGSVLLGFVFACSVVKFHPSPADFTCMCGFLFMVFADTLTTLYIRFRDAEKLTQSHRRHLYQILCNEGGLAHWKISLIYCFIEILISVMMLVAWGKGFAWQVLLLIVCAAIYIVAGQKIRQRLVTV